MVLPPVCDEINLCNFEFFDLEMEGHFNIGEMGNNLGRMLRKINKNGYAEVWFKFWSKILFYLIHFNNRYVVIIFYFE